MTQHKGAMVRPDANADSFASFYRDYHGWAVRFAFSLTGDLALAEDIAQDAFVGLGARFEAVGHPSAYLRSSIVNAVRTTARRNERAAEFRRQRPEPFVPSHLVEFFDVLQRLPIRQRAAIVLRYLEDVDDDDIALALNCRRSTVRSLVRRGLRQLREALPT